MSVKIGHASGSENGTIKGNAGDQTGKEVYIRTWYKHKKGWVTLRCKVPEMREYIAEAMEKACANPNIGYDQYENDTLWENIKDKGFDPSKTTKKVETDCARLIRVCVQYAVAKMGLDIIIPDFYTATLANTLVKTGLFEKLTDAKYNTQDKFLIRSDIQVTKTKGHTICILENGSGVESATESKSVLKKGFKGAEVVALQNLLIGAGYPLPKYGADGDFGTETLNAVKSFQKACGLEVDGIVGEKTLNALRAVQSVTKVLVTGNSVNLRYGAGTKFNIYDTVHKGDELEYLGTASNGWFKVVWNKVECFISNKYSKLK